MSASLQTGGGLGFRVHVVSCYAPTRAVNRDDKEAFLQKLDSIISTVPAKENYVNLGDFNAWLESMESVDEQWDGMEVLMDMDQYMMLEESCYPSLFAPGNRMQYLVPTEDNPQENLAAHQMQEMELH